MGTDGTEPPASSSGASALPMGDVDGGVVVEDPACTHQLIAVQDRLLQRLHSSAEGLKAFNEKSAAGYKDAATEMARNTELLRTVKTDVHAVIVRVAQLKRRLKAKYPTEFAAATASEPS